MTKIAVSSEGDTLDSMVDPRFGRAGGFIILDTANSEITYVDNGASQIKTQGAGIATVERLSELGVEVVLSGYVGPKAFDTLKIANIKVCQDLDDMTVGAAIDLFIQGKAPFSEVSNKV